MTGEDALPPEGEGLMRLLAAKARSLLSDELPEGYTVTEYLNGNFYGQTADRTFDIRSKDRTEVEHWLFIHAAGREVQRRKAAA